MKLVGQAFRENALNIDPSKKTVVLGIANWRTIREKEALITENVRRLLNSSFLVNKISICFDL